MRKSLICIISAICLTLSSCGNEKSITVIFTNDTKGKHGYLWMQGFDEIKSVTCEVIKYDPPIELSRKVVYDSVDSSDLISVLSAILAAYTAEDWEMEKKFSTPRHNKMWTAHYSTPAFESYKKRGDKFASFDKVVLEMRVQHGEGYICLLRCFFDGNSQIQHINIKEVNGKFSQSAASADKQIRLRTNYIISSYTTDSYKLK